MQPGRPKESRCGWYQPAHRGGSADTVVAERRGQVLQPDFSRAAIGVRENQNFEFWRELFDSDTQVVHFFAAILSSIRDDQVGFGPRAGNDAI